MNIVEEEVQVTCRNCDKVFSGNYCPQCGVKKEEEPINAKTQVRQIFHDVLNIEKYFFQTTIDFIIRPGIAGMNYLEGKRRGYHRPVAFAIIWITLYSIIHALITSQHNYEYILVSPDLTQENAAAKIWMYTHIMVILFPALAIVAFPCYFILGYPKINYFEMLTLTFYAEGCISFYRILQDVILGVILGININHEFCYLAIFAVSGLYNIWFCYDLFKRFHLQYLWPRLILSFLSVVVLNKFNFDYLTLLGMYLTE
jgi:hypothetical protein